MLFQHTVLYFLARGFPGLINFLALSVYTRLFIPDVYGRYALALATVSFASNVLFQWIQLGLLRFLPQFEYMEARLLSTILAAYLMMVAFTGCIGAAIYALLEPGFWRAILPLTILLLWVQAWFEINLQLLSSRLKPMRYGILAGARAILALALGGAFASAGWEARAPLWGLVIGGAAAALLFSRGAWKSVSYKHFDRGLFQELARYGFPLGITFVFSFVISTSDRYLIGWLIDEKSVGLYAAAYDLTQFSLGVLMMIVNLAAYPIIVRALEHEGIEAAREQIKRQGLLLMSIAAPATAGFIVLAENISSVLLGTEFRIFAASIVPWIAGAALVGGIKAYYFDLAFQLGKSTKGQLWVVMIASLVNILLNVAWIPSYGLLGAAWATLAACTVGLLLSAWLGRLHFKLPHIGHGAKVFAAVALMVATIWPVHEQKGPMVLLGQVVLGSSCYAISLWIFNPGRLRADVMLWMRSVRSRLAKEPSLI